MKDTYKTIEQDSEETLFKDKNSKFYGYAFAIETEEELKEKIEVLKKKHHTARHFCYAYQLGKEYENYRANDDGEPNNSAGMPIYGQLQSFDVTNIAVVVVRLFGGVKLGVSGLINAYKTSAQITLETATIVEKTIDESFIVKFEYKNLNKVMRIIKEKELDIVSQTMELSCEIIVSCRKKHFNDVLLQFKELHEIEVKKFELNFIQNI